MLLRSASRTAALVALSALPAACAAAGDTESPASVIAPDGSVPEPSAGSDVDAGVIHGHGLAPDGGAAGCPADALPALNPCVVDETYGVFVASTAAPGGDGSRARPFTTLSAGIVAAKAAKKRVYACAGTYAEALEIQNGVSMFGGFTCAASIWIPAAEHARVQSPTSPAARASAITVATRIDGMDVSAPDGGLARDASQPAKSSIALLASNAAALMISNAILHAGSAQSGADGADALGVTQAAASVDGAAAFPPRRHCIPIVATCATGSLEPNAGAAGGTSDCRFADGTASAAALNGGAGGRGGYPAHYYWASIRRDGTDLFDTMWMRDVAPGDGYPLAANAQTAAGALHVAMSSIVNVGHAGVSGTAGANGAAAAGMGSLSASGLVPAEGSNSANGAPGQGGGGGAGLDHDHGDGSVIADAPPDWMDGATGSGGGAGGCAGVGGQRGQSGGSSLAIVVVDSGLHIDGVTLETASGGNAGRGGKGSAGTPGGVAGARWTSYGSRGGAGGAGAAGGAGGSGRGGHSIGIAFTGVVPTATNMTYRLGAAGAGAPSFDAPTGTVAASQAGVQAQTQKL